MSSSSRSDSCIGVSSGASATASTASSWTSTSSSSSRGSISSCASIASLCRIAGEPVAQRGVGADRGRRRVVQLVGEARGERAEGQQLLALADDLLGVAHAEEQALEQVDGHREPVAHGVAEVLAADHEQPRVADAPHRGGVGLRSRRRPGSSASRRRRPRRWSVRTVSTSSGPTRRLIAMVPDSSTIDQLGRLALVEDRGAGRHLGDPAALGEPAQLLVGERLEQEQRAQLVVGQPLGRSARW